MKNLKLTYVIFFVFLAFTSCQKEDLTPDQATEQANDQSRRSPRMITGPTKSQINSYLTWFVNSDYDNLDDGQLGSGVYFLPAGGSGDVYDIHVPPGYDKVMVPVYLYWWYVSSCDEGTEYYPAPGQTIADYLHEQVDPYYGLSLFRVKMNGIEIPFCNMSAQFYGMSDVLTIMSEYYSTEDCTTDRITALMGGYWLVMRNPGPGFSVLVEATSSTSGNYGYSTYNFH